MNENVTFSIDEVLLDAEKAFKERQTRLLSQTLYQFLPDVNKLIIQDLDVIVLHSQCTHNIQKLTLKSIRKASVVRCN